MGNSVLAVGFVFRTGEALALDANVALHGQELDGTVVQIKTSFEHITVHHDPSRPKLIVVEDEEHTSIVAGNFEESENLIGKYNSSIVFESC